jgi:hypothetical protein
MRFPLRRHVDDGVDGATRSTGTMIDCYVYYRIALQREHEARAAVAALLAEVEEKTGIRGTAHRKTVEPLLWMEVYRGIADSEAFVALVAGLSARLGLDACLEDNQRRHVEEFVPLNTDPAITPD